MVRMIDANRLKDAIYTDFWEHFTKCHDSDQTALIDMVMDDIDEMPTRTPPNEWVSVEERLPTDEHPVLVFVGYADTMTGFITTSSYFAFDANPHWQWDGLVGDEQRTLFWMPLPAPPDRRPPEGET